MLLVCDMLGLVAASIFVPRYVIPRRQSSSKCHDKGEMYGRRRRYTWPVIMPSSMLRGAISIGMAGE